MLDLLKKLGVTSEADLRARLGMEDEPTSADGASEGSVQDATPPAPDPDNPERAQSDSGDGETGRGTGERSGGGRVQGEGHGGRTKGSGQDGITRSRTSRGGRPFISYVAVQHEEEEPDPDDLD